MHVFELCKLHVGQEVASCRWTATSCKVAPSDNTAQCMTLTLASIYPLHCHLNQDQDTLVYITHLHPHTHNYGTFYKKVNVPRAYNGYGYGQSLDTRTGVVDFTYM